MNANDRYLASPFIALDPSRNEEFFMRQDRPARRLRATPLVSAILTSLTQPRTMREVNDVLVADGHGAHDVALLMQQLVDAGFAEQVGHTDLRLPSIELELTNVCNAACIMCPRKDLRPAGMMTDETFARSVELIRSLECGVMLQGLGEATLHKDLVASVERLRDAIGPELPIVLVTNGFRMPGVRYQELLDAGLSLLQWSFHSLKEEVYNHIMQARQFARAKNNLVECAEVDADHLYINFVEMAENAGEYQDIVAFAGQLGIDSRNVGLIPVFNRGGTIDSLALGGHERAHRVPRCVYAVKTMFIAWNGDIMPCSNDTRAELVYANVADEMSALLDSWRARVSRPFDSGPCIECDHLTRETMETAWFDLATVASSIPSLARP